MVSRAAADKISGLINFCESHVGHHVFFFSSEDEGCLPIRLQSEKIISEITFHLVCNTMAKKWSCQLI
jgi:hypothetical protein